MPAIWWLIGQKGRIVFVRVLQDQTAEQDGDAIPPGMSVEGRLGSDGDQCLAGVNRDERP
jgi:hypothetical protein